MYRNIIPFVVLLSVLQVMYSCDCCMLYYYGQQKIKCVLNGFHADCENCQRPETVTAGSVNYVVSVAPIPDNKECIGILCGIIHVLIPY